MLTKYFNVCIILLIVYCNKFLTSFIFFILQCGVGGGGGEDFMVGCRIGDSIIQLAAQSGKVFMIMRYIIF